MHKKCLLKLEQYIYSICKKANFFLLRAVLTESCKSKHQMVEI